MEFEDRSGKPRSTGELKATLEQVENSIIRVDRVPLELAVHLPTIREALIELIDRRAMVVYG